MSFNALKSHMQSVKNESKLHAKLWLKWPLIHIQNLEITEINLTSYVSVLLPKTCPCPGPVMFLLFLFAFSKWLLFTTRSIFCHWITENSDSTNQHYTSFLFLLSFFFMDITDKLIKALEMCSKRIKKHTQVYPLGPFFFINKDITTNNRKSSHSSHFNTVF